MLCKICLFLNKQCFAKSAYSFTAVNFNFRGKMERAKSSKSESVPFTNLGTTQSVTHFKSSLVSSSVFPPIRCPITLLEKRTSILAELSGVRGSPPSWDGGRLCDPGGQGLLPEEYDGVCVGSNFFFLFLS